jgi:hypothetical protein
VARFDIYKLYLVNNPAIWKYEWQGLGTVVCMALAQNNVEILTYLLETVGADPQVGPSKAPGKAAYSSH